MTRLRPWLFDASAPRSVILIRLLVGCVFFSEGVQKFLYPVALGVGRFQKIGIPAPQFFAPFVGVVEIVCGALVIVGLFTRLASIPLLIDISLLSRPPKFRCWPSPAFGRRYMKREPTSACFWDRSF